MKKIFAVVLACIIVVISSGCNLRSLYDAKIDEEYGIYKIHGICLGDDIESLIKKYDVAEKDYPNGYHDKLYSYKNIEFGSFYADTGIVTSIAVLSGEYLGFELSKSTIKDVQNKYGKCENIVSEKYGFVDEFDKDKFKCYTYKSSDFELRFYFENNTLMQIWVYGYYQKIYNKINNIVITSKPLYDYVTTTSPYSYGIEVDFVHYEINGIRLGNKLSDLKQKYGSELVDKSKQFDGGTVYSYKNVDVGSFFGDNDTITSIAVTSGKYLGLEISKSNNNDVIGEFGNPKVEYYTKYEYSDEDFDKSIYKCYAYRTEPFELRFYFEKNILKQIWLYGYYNRVVGNIDSNQRGNYSNSIPKMTAENQEIYNKYIEKYVPSFMFEHSWNEKDHSGMSSIYEVYKHLYGYEEFLITADIVNHNYLSDFKDIKRVFSEKMVISESELINLFKPYYSKEYNKYTSTGAVGIPNVRYIVTDHKIENGILTVYIDNYDDSIANGESYKFDQNGNVYAVPRSKITVQIKLEDNGEFKFLSNDIKDV